jgi:hypothetical protein
MNAVPRQLRCLSMLARVAVEPATRGRCSGRNRCPPAQFRRLDVLDP